MKRLVMLVLLCCCDAESTAIGDPCRPGADSECPGECLWGAADFGVGSWCAPLCAETLGGPDSCGEWGGVCDATRCVIPCGAAQCADGFECYETSEGPQCLLPI